MKKLMLLLLSLFITCHLYSQFPLFFSKTGSGCEYGAHVSENRPTSCSLPDGYKLYPVYTENFNYKNELPNNWRFDWGCPMDDDVGDEGKGLCWVGSSQDGLESFNRDLVVSNGVAYIQVNPTSSHNNANGWGCGCPTGNCVSNKNYNFTTSLLNGYFYFRQGRTDAKIRIPNNNLMWPAFWLYGANSEEIDIFEFYDSEIASNDCDVYSDMRMTLHGEYAAGTGSAGLQKCERGRKFPATDIAGDFFNNFHVYSSDFDDYQVDIYVDNTRVGTTTKFYDGDYGSPACHYHGEHNLPGYNYGCEAMIQLASGIDVYADYAFPTPNARPMTARINSSLNMHGVDGSGQSYDQTLMNSWSSWSREDLEIAVDQFIVWQPINCSASYNVATETDFGVNSGNTSFLGGNNITVGSASGSTMFNPMSDLYAGVQKNFQLLATDYIAFVGDVQINSGGSDSYTYLRAEIIDCSQARPLGDLNDSVPRQQASTATSIAGVSKTDNGAVKLYPNPASNSIKVSMVDEDFYDITQMEIIDNLGRKFPVEKSDAIDISFLPNGFYELKLVFSQGMIVVKSFVKND